MTLLEESWIPVRRRDGTRDWISPLQISQPDIVALSADRPDFNGALAQLIIGLLQTVLLRPDCPVQTEQRWAQLFDNPPDSGTLAEWLSPFSVAFELDGAGARFMQDFSLRPDQAVENEIGSLLIDCPGENATKNNTDLFVKRGLISAMCRHCAATALLTLQTNAPAGGQGYRVGLRGGGPLTTLILSEPPSSLWRDLWLNVQPARYFLGDGGEPERSELHYIFPWLADNSAIQKEGGELAPAQVHPAHVFFGMPRRIRLDFEHTRAGRCDICQREPLQLISRYITKNYGLNYKGNWSHPLSPYYQGKEGWLPVHPQPGGIGYRHWLAWVCGVSSDKSARRPARSVDNFLTRRPRLSRAPLRLWAFGYDMDNMKARCWYESTLPLYHLAECPVERQRQIAADVALWLSGAELAAHYLRSAVQDAWFSGEVRGDLSAIDASFWSDTQPMFYAHLTRLIELHMNDTQPDDLPMREQWRLALCRAALRLFDEDFVGAGAVERQNPARIAKAYRQLEKSLRGPKMRKALGLPAQLARSETGDEGKVLAI